MRFQTTPQFRVAGLIVSMLTIPAWAEMDTTFFQTPPAEARPLTWMHWMNNNASEEGMTKDLESMAEVGIGGALIFSVDKGIPEGKIIFNSDQYRKIVVHSAKEAERLGLEIGVHNCDGWSSSGGPWVTVEDSMKRVVWSEVLVQGGNPVALTLPQPPTRLGFYRDIAIVAYPATPTELAMAALTPVITSSIGRLDVRPLLSSSLDDTVRLRGSAKTPQWLQLTYDKPFRAESVSVEHNSPQAKFTLLASEDGVTFKPVAKLDTERTGKETRVSTQSFKPVTARAFRIQSDVILEVRQLKLLPFAQFPNWLSRSSLARISDDQLSPIPSLSSGESIPLDGIRVIKQNVGPGGTLSLSLPAGPWRVMRFGYTTTAASNQPSTAEGKGLECDKLNRAALDKHFAAYVGKLADECGPLTGKSFRFSEIDSYEMGGQNWTEGLAEQFRVKNGYDLTPFLPLLAGRLIGNPEITTAVLRDFRSLICSLMAENYYRRFTELCHERGMKSYIEPYGNGPLNQLTVGGLADIPMGEFWLRSGDVSILKSAASAAHTYGKPVVSAESFTSRAELNWKIHPYLMKLAGDCAWTEGVNQFMFHRFAHQANTHVTPGMTMGNIGSQIDRTQTWWTNAGKAWIQYLHRGSWLLRQGVPVSDVLVYVGEASPHGVPTKLQPPLPNGYTFDACDTEVLLNRITVKDGRLVLPEGTRYRVLALHNCENLSLATLQRIQALAQAGAIIAGPKPIAPIGYQELQTRRTEFAALVDALWGTNAAASHVVGRGKVFRELTWSAIFGELGLASDFTALDPGETAYIHRESEGTDIYFVLNKESEPRTLRASFRVNRRLPERWDADTGRIESLAQFTTNGGRTEFAIPLPPRGSAFVVFRQSSSGFDPVVRAELNGSPLVASAGQILNSGAGELLVRAPANGVLRVTQASGRSREISVVDVRAPLPVTGRWKVVFDERYGGPGETAFDTLMDWKEHAAKGIRYYSGTAVYRKTVTIPGEWLNGPKRILLDLGRVEIAAEVWINGKQVGMLWKPPFIVAVTDAVRPGENELEIRVTNPWTNRLIGDEQFKQTNGYDSKGKMVEWYVRNEPPPASERTTFTTYNFYENDHTLLSSGLLGPVRFFQEAQMTLK